jgi:single-stranded DNA-binding protein
VFGQRGNPNSEKDDKLVRGINRVIISGNISGRVSYNETSSGTPACSFSLASDRYASGSVVTAWVKVNVYGDGLVRTCSERLIKGLYVLVEGELMNRGGQTGELTEIRAKEIIFLTLQSYNQEGGNHESG